MIWTLLCVALLATSVVALNSAKLEFPSTFTEDDAVLSKISSDIAYAFENEYIAFLKTGIESPTLGQLSDKLKKTHTNDILTAEVENMSPANQFFMCTTCRAAINVLIRMIREDGGELNGPTGEITFRKIALHICILLDMQSKEVCEGLIDLNLSIIQYIILNSKISSKSACGTIFQASFCKANQDEYTWSIKINGTDGLKITGPKSSIPAKGNNDLHIIQLTDIHYQPQYKPGALAECDQPMCCQRPFDDAAGSSNAAGKWGDYRHCDTPWYLLTDAIEHIKRAHPKIDYIYNTGDIVDHNVWTTSRESNMKSLTKVFNYLKEALGDIPMYPIVGNHEAHPLNVFGPPTVPEEFSALWLYKHLAELWSHWLPEETKQTILLGGYYTVSPRPGFRIIALNNNECYTFNWWILYDGSLFSGQLQWLHDTLLAAESAGEYVHILAHMPSGARSCWNVWAREYNRIVERFTNTISGIFNGHTHWDEMNVFYSSGNQSHAINIAWNGGSLTTYSYKNPNYRKYQVEPKTLQVVEHETWIFNLTEANEHPNRSPVWYKEYIFGEEYGLKDLSPASIDELLDRFAESPQLMRKYWRYYVTMADPKLAEGCNNKCLLKRICQLATTNPTRLDRCKELQNKLQQSLDKEPPSTEAPPITTNKPNDNGVGSGATPMLAFRITSTIGLFAFLNFLF